MLSGRSRPLETTILSPGQSPSSTGLISTARVTQIIVALVVLVPPLGVLIGDRNLTVAEFLETLDLVPPFVLIRWATLVVVLLSVFLMYRAMRKPIETPRGYAVVMYAFTVYFVTNVLLCVPFGEVPWITRAHLYPLLFFTAVYLCSDDGAEGMLAAAKWSLLIFMVCSLMCLFVLPDLTRRLYAPEVRLPFIDFRFWGLGEHANSIGPLALLLTLLTLHRPFSRRKLTQASLIVSGIVVLLSQSQTAWLIALIVIPGYLCFSSSRKLSPVTRLMRSPLLLVPLATLALAVFGLAVTDSADTGALLDAPQPGDGWLTGRPDAWQAALETFANHPVFGYGLTAWNPDFRWKIHLLWAVHAHNQLLQSMSVAGLVGAIGLLIYVGVLIQRTCRVASATQGLAPALLFLILARMITEVPINIGSIMLGDTIFHLLLFRLLTSPLQGSLAYSPQQQAPQMDYQGQCWRRLHVLRRQVFDTGRCR